MTWCHLSGTYAKIFGDNDRLPTGNLLGCFWQSRSYTADAAYDAKIVEIVRATKELAFEATFYSDRSCAADDDDGSCDVDGSWLT